jgi:hypothetical protein
MVGGTYSDAELQDDGKSSDSGRRMAADMQRELGLRAARIWERLSDDQRAETRYQTVLDLENDNHSAVGPRGSIVSAAMPPAGRDAARRAGLKTTSPSASR